MPVARPLIILAAFANLAFSAEMRGTWSATSGGQNLAGTWTAETQSGVSVSGTWTLRGPSGQLLMQGGWSASKSPEAWNGGWRATVEKRAGEFAGTWEARTELTPKATLGDMLESAVRAVVSGTWKAGGSAGAWSIRASP